MLCFGKMISDKVLDWQRGGMKEKQKKAARRGSGNESEAYVEDI